ncbi:MAG: DUF1844 domain-containing protein [Verrucomicrobia bacterium]|nr:DUF1844 domain-containing protein [Verrucomicrobiota bacterium]
MSDDQNFEKSLNELSRDEKNAVLFSNLVLQQNQMAELFLGKSPHPDSGQNLENLEMAKLTIDTVEMLEAKTKNNLSKNEADILANVLTNLRMTYVEAVNRQKKSEAPSAKENKPGDTQTAEQQPKSQNETDQKAKTDEEESRVRYSKKYE